ncbi:hypothetical protein AURDEDRAFT_163568 [Auricularia subglabra TFB-10046 SS5]|nr:hypothetical protein AURDEDRAFT_163568 [Auricularia subglabra TFB-10046 SS5]
MQVDPICQSQRAGEYAHQAAQVLHVANNQGQRGSPILNVIEGPDAWGAADDPIRAAVHFQEPLLLNVAHVPEWQEDTLPRSANMPISPAQSPAAPDERISLERASLDEISAVRTEHGLVAWGNIDPDGILLHRQSLPHLGIDRCIYMLPSTPPPV